MIILREIRKIFYHQLYKQKRQRTKEDPRAVEQILSYIDRRRPPRQKKYRVTWRTFIGTMSGIDHVYAREDFLQYYTEFRPLVVFMDSVFRGIGQVMFANSSLSGSYHYNWIIDWQLGIGFVWSSWYLCFNINGSYLWFQFGRYSCGIIWIQWMFNSDGHCLF